MINLVARLNKNRFFRFFSSVQLAVPLFLVLICVVAGATIIESRYNSEYATLLVYDSWWFNALMVLLWINICLSTLSRIPYKKRHFGFVTVHLGLMTLLIGGLVTKLYGVDGQLRVIEGSQGSQVVLSDLSLELIDVQADSAIRVPFSRSRGEKSGSDLDSLNNKFNSKIIARRFLPFAEVRDQFVSLDQGLSDGPTALGFMLKSQFFDVSEWLHSDHRPEMQMGPATIRLIIDKQPPVNSDKKRKPSANAVDLPQGKKNRKSKVTSDHLLIKDEISDKTILKILIKDLKPGLKLPNNGTLTAVKTYQHAVVTDNRLAEGHQPGANPAIEIHVQSGGKNIREVSYAKFPGFSLTQGKGTSLGFKIEYKVSGELIDTEVAAREGEATEHQHQNQEQGSNANLSGGNLIEFHVSKNSTSARVKLFKDKKPVAESTLNPGESMITPWMGMKLTLGSIKQGAVSKTEANPALVQPRSDLPPGAVFITTAGSAADQGFWLAEGQFRQVSILGRQYEVYFGRRTLALPFVLNLLEFKKVDYPGTETPMSFESRVKVNGQGSEHVVSMNEPLKHDGFTLYQSSYDIRPGQPKASIFSVNRDPGRAIKYAGSLILCLGIVLFTLMRSRVFQNLAKAK